MLNIKTDNNAIDNDEDKLGGGSFILESGIYNMHVELAYATESQGGAVGIVLHFGSKDSNKSLRQTLWLTNRNKENFYVDKKTGDKHTLPGFNMANSLSLLTIGKEITEVPTEEKVVKLYDFDSKKEVPTTVPVFTDLLYKDITLAVVKQTVDKNVKNDDGIYVPSGETREENEIDKMFRTSDRKTVAEIKSEAEEASFINEWEKKWTGVTRNKAKGAKAGGAKPASKPQTTTKSLFG